MYNCNLRYAINSIHVFKASPEFYGCVVEDFLVRGFYIDGHYSNPPITPIIDHCIARQNDTTLQVTGVGIFVYRMVDVTIYRCEVSNCRYGMEFLGSGTYTPHFQIASCEIHDIALYGIYTHAGGG